MMKVGGCNSCTLAARTGYESEKSTRGNENRENVEQAVRYDSGEGTEKNDYEELGSKKKKISDIQRMKMRFEQQAAGGIIDIIKKEANAQAIGYKRAIQNFIKDGKATIEMVQKARADIAPGGFLSPEKTAGRIVDFAKKIAENNPEMADKLKLAIYQGFHAAEQAWGDSLPGICLETKDIVMKELDNWQTEE